MNNIVYVNNIIYELSALIPLVVHEMWHRAHQIITKKGRTQNLTWFDNIPTSTGGRENNCITNNY